MAKERDYKHEYELQKGKRNDTSISICISKQTAKDFNKKIELEDITRNAFLKACIKAYLDDEITIDDLALYL